MNPPLGADGAGENWLRGENDGAGADGAGAYGAGADGAGAIRGAAWDGGGA